MGACAYFLFQVVMLQFSKVMEKSHHLVFMPEKIIPTICSAAGLCKMKPTANLHLSLTSFIQKIPMILCRYFFPDLNLNKNITGKNQESWSHSLLVFTRLQNFRLICINAFPNKPLFLCVYSKNLLKTLWKRRNCSMSNFFFSHSVCYPGV